VKLEGVERAGCRAITICGTRGRAVHGLRPALALKAALPRLMPAGDIGDTDVYGAQQHCPLLDVDIPI
jgi:hypothetical protein